MRINKYVALSSGLSRRAVDKLIGKGAVTVNGLQAHPGQDVSDADQITVSGEVLSKAGSQKLTTIILNKPVGYVCSRDGQGSRTIYELLPDNLHHLKPVGRLDKDSSGLLVMTNDGELAHRLTHPSFQKQKVYNIRLDRDLTPLHHQMITDHGIQLDDGPSKFSLSRLIDGNNKGWQVTIAEGRNRQIRRTFTALGYSVTKLHRISFGEYNIDDLEQSTYKQL